MASNHAFLRSVTVGLTAFLTVVDLFATQAILPALTQAYGVTPAAMGVAVNATTLGMAIASLAVAVLSRHIDRRLGIFWSLALLTIPTALLAIAPDLLTFGILRVIQGLLMASAFTLTLAYLGEHTSAQDTAGVFAAYITGNVASNLFGRLISASTADHFGLTTNFLTFAILNLAGAILAYRTVCRTRPMTMGHDMSMSMRSAVPTHLKNGALQASFGIGFCILFAFIGTFTYVNFVLVRPPIALEMMNVGFVYFVFLPAILTTPLAGRAVRRFGTRLTVVAALGLACAGLAMTLSDTLTPVLAGLTLIGVGTFFAQATATGFVGKAAETDRGAASGLYLAFYFLGGLAGSAVLGLIFDRFGWVACAAGIGVSLIVAMLLAIRLTIPASSGMQSGPEQEPLAVPAKS